MSAIQGFTTALSGMKVAQNQLGLISQNIANADTAGYTRKTAAQYSNVLGGTSQGVFLGNITRTVNEGLLRSYLSSNSLSGNYAAQNEYLSKTEALLGTPQSDNSIAANVSNLQSAFNTFSTDVTSAAGRFTLLNNAQTITSRLNSITTEIQKLRGDADVAITGACEEINSLLDSLHELNESIVKYTVLGYDGVADLEDRRDQALRDLSDKIDITYFKRENGAIVIQSQDGITLLDNKPHYLSHSAVTQASPTSTYASGEIGGIFVDGQDVTNFIRNGEIKGLIEIRDVTLPSLQSQLDELAGVLKQSINEVHNQGTAYPATPSSMTGTRTFINPDDQKISIASGDVRFTIFDEDGTQVATTTLVGELGFNDGSISDMTTALQNWMRDPAGGNLPQANVSINNDGKLVIDTGDSEYTISIMDTATSTPGSEQQNTTIKFAANGSNNYDREFEGFSSFFGMNDFFVSQNNESIYDSKVLSKDLNLNLRDPVILSFSDESHGLNYGNISVMPGDSVQDIVNKINEDPTLNQNMRASLVPNGSGYILRIVNSSGEQLEISENRLDGDPAPGLISKLGLSPSNATMAGSIEVRNDLVNEPNLIAAGAPEFDKNSGKYQQNPAVNTVANAMAQAFTDTHTFGQSGIIAKTTTTIANYASTFVGSIASQTANSESNLAYQQELSNSIATKEAQISGVDVDEELGQMIMFQQTYAACAKAFTASKEILDMLLNMV